MKTITLSFFLLLLYQPLTFSQYIQMPFATGAWTTRNIAYDDTENEYYTICDTMRQLDQPTIINNKTYYPFGNSQSWFGYIRQEEAVVFYIPHFYNNPTTQEFPVFDFGLEIGDTTTIYNFTFEEQIDSTVAWVTATDTVQIHGNLLRRKIQLQSQYNIGCDQQMTWYEGFGANTPNPFYWWTYCNNQGNAQSTFNCFTDNDTIVSGICFCEEGFPTSVSNPNVDIPISLAPNPVSDILLIQASLPYSAALYNLQGQALFHFKDQSEWDLSELAVGTYFIHFQTAQGQKIERIVKW